MHLRCPFGGELKCWGIWSYEVGEVVGDDEPPASLCEVPVM